MVEIAASTIVVGGLSGIQTQGDSIPSNPAIGEEDDEATITEINPTKQITKNHQIMYLHIYGSATPGDTLTIEAITDDNSPMTDAEIVINDQTVEMTDENGHAEIVVPDEEEFDLEVRTEIAEIDVHQRLTTVDADEHSEIDIETKATADETIQSTTSSQSRSTSSQLSTSSVETSTNISIETDE